MLRHQKYIPLNVLFTIQGIAQLFDFFKNGLPSNPAIRNQMVVILALLNTPNTSQNDRTF